MLPAGGRADLLPYRGIPVTIESVSQTGPATPAAEELTDEERQFFLFGFRRVLRRFLRMSALGWAITAGGAACLLVFWREPLPHGAFDLLLSAGGMAAGLGLVQTNLASLQSYVTVPFPGLPGRVPPELLAMLRGWMKDVAEGGWRDAYAVLQQLEKIIGEQEGAGLWPTV
jgi:hypothetical protein